MAAPESIPPDLFLTGYPPGIREVAERLRPLVRDAVPEANRAGPRRLAVIGDDVPLGRRTRCSAFVAPEPEHVHLGFECGIWMTDPDGLLLGAHLDLRKVRFVTCEPGDPVPTDALVRYTRETADLATLGSAGQLVRGR